MKKKCLIKKIFLIMRQTFYMLFACLINISASVYSQKFSYESKNASIKDLLTEIESNSTYKFLYRTDIIDVSREVELNMKDADVATVLSTMFPSDDITYRIFDDNLVVITKVNLLQEQKVTGTVTDAITGEFLPGVNILIEGTNNGTTTDVNGKFSINVPSKDAVLVFSYIGYLGEKVTLAGQSILDLKLSPEITKLEEVVVVGYGTVKKTDLTGSVSSISSEDYSKMPVNNFSTAIQGRAAGVSIATQSGAPGGAVKIRIRGSNSINGNNDPLYVVDGIQLATTSIQDVNPNDIQSIEVLKDASATAIYGSRGANGVIMITTKKGTSEKPRLEFTAFTGVSQTSYKYDILKAGPFAELYNTYKPNTFSTAQIDEFNRTGGTDWQDEIFQTGINQNYQLSLSGTTSKTSYFISGNYIDQTGIVLNTDYKKYALRANLDTKVNDKLTIGVNLFISRTDALNTTDMGSKGSPVWTSAQFSPVISVYDENGDWNKRDPYGAVTSWNPVMILKNSNAGYLSNSALINTKLNYKFTDWLTFDFTAGLDATMYQGKGSTPDLWTTSSAYKNNTSSMNWQISNVLTFHKVFGQHDLTALAVFEESKFTSDYTSANGTDLAYPSTQYDNLGVSAGTAISSSYTQASLRSYVGRVAYTLANKYLFTFTYRADGSSKFPNNKWGYFPSAAIGWRLSEEEFIKNLDIFDNLKLRGSWGITGSQAVGPYATIPSMSSGFYSFGTSVSQLASWITDPANPDLKWETTNQTDIGIDMGFFKNRLSFSADYFMKKTKDLLLAVSIPAYAGGGSYMDNIGKVENNGIEAIITAVPFDKKDFDWQVSFNISSYKNKVVELAPDQEYIDGAIYGGGLMTKPVTRVIVGEPLGTFYGLKFDGIYQESDAAAAAVFSMNPGDNNYRNLDGNSKIDYDDRMIIGHANPKFSWGLDNTVTYKNFEFNLFILAVHGNKVMNTTYYAACAQTGDATAITSADVTPWTAENQNNMWPKITSATSKEFLESSKWLQDGSFVRVKNLSIGYNLPRERVKFMDLKLTLSAQNLLTFTKYKGFDPEASTSTGDVDSGIDLGAYPSARTFTFGIQMTF